MDGGEEYVKCTAREERGRRKWGKELDCIRDFVWGCGAGAGM